MGKVRVALLEIAINLIVLLIGYKISNSFFCGGITAVVCVYIDKAINDWLLK